MNINGLISDVSSLLDGFCFNNKFKYDIYSYDGKSISTHIERCIPGEQIFMSWGDPQNEHQFDVRDTIYEINDYVSSIGYKLIVDRELTIDNDDIVNHELVDGFLSDDKRDISILDKLGNRPTTSLYIYISKKNGDKVNEGLPNQKTVDQWKMLRRLTKGIDIGDRISDMSKQGANIQHISNPIDTGIESFEDFERNNKSFIPSWNLKNLLSPFEFNKKVKKKRKNN